MPRTPSSSRELLGYTIKGNRPVIAETLASVIGHGPRSEKAESDRRLFWTPALSLEQAAQLAATGMQPFELARQEFPWRFDAVDKDGRDTLKKQAAWVQRMVKLGPPEDLIRQPAAPDPMTLAPEMQPPPPPMPMPVPAEGMPV